MGHEAGCDLVTGSTIARRPNVKAGSCATLNKWQALTGHISGQSEAKQPASAAPAQQAIASPTPHGHTSCEARYQTRLLGLPGDGHQELGLYYLYVKRINIEVTMEWILATAVDSFGRRA